MPDADDGAPFIASAETFADANACVAHLARFVEASAPPAFAASAGPYRIADGDMRAHRIRPRDWGHEIEELRCLGAALSSRVWRHSMSDVKSFTVEDIGKMSFPGE